MKWFYQIETRPDYGVASMKPTWETNDGAIRLYCADCLKVLPRDDDELFFCADCHKQFHAAESQKCSYCDKEICQRCWDAHWEREDHQGWDDPEGDLPEPAEPFLVVEKPAVPKPVEDDPLKPKPRLFLW